MAQFCVSSGTLILSELGSTKSLIQ